MRFLSVCSGIEAASVAWKPLGWEAVGFSEIEPFPCSVLAHHYPHVRNFGDLTKWENWIDDVAEFDVLAGGTPCQGFSVAGRRGGLDDPRSQLAFDFLGIAGRRKPSWIVWENVPGVLSSGGGRDFGAFLGELGKCGYGFAYRVLDAQYFGLAQRRKRVFVVGYLGDWRPAAAVLLESESVRGHPAPSRETGQGTAAGLGASTGGVSGKDAADGRVVAQPLRSGRQYSDMGDGQANVVMVCDPNQMTSKTNRLVAGEVAPCLRSNHHNNSDAGMEAQMLVAHAAAGYMLPVPIQYAEQLGCEKRQNGMGLGDEGDPMFTLECRQPYGVAAPITASYGKQVDSSDTSKGPPNLLPWPAEVSDTLDAHFGDKQGLEDQHVNSGCPRFVPAAMAVRRLTPRECERLQGFPDDYTLVPHRGKPAADGPRYKALGNSWATPCARWIGERIESLTPPQPA